jgi:hypothetical protein
MFMPLLLLETLTLELGARALASSSSLIYVKTMKTKPKRAPRARKAAAKAAKSGRARPSMNKPPVRHEKTAAEMISRRIEELGDWRGETLAKVREIIKAADPAIVEEWKWTNPVWSHHGLICTGESYKKAVKMTFAQGASLADPSGLFNSSLAGKVRRAIDIHEADSIDEAALKQLIRAAIALNLKGRSKESP